MLTQQSKLYVFLSLLIASTCCYLCSVSVCFCFRQPILGWGNLSDFWSLCPHLQRILGHEFHNFPRNQFGHWERMGEMDDTAVLQAMMVQGAPLFERLLCSLLINEVNNKFSFEMLRCNQFPHRRPDRPYRVCINHTSSFTFNVKCSWYFLKMFSRLTVFSACAVFLIPIGSCVVVDWSVNHLVYKCLAPLLEGVLRLFKSVLSLLFNASSFWCHSCLNFGVNKGSSLLWLTLVFDGTQQSSQKLMYDVITSV